MDPNILIIVVDALRADRVGVFNNQNLTPNVDNLTNESVVFKNAFTTANATDVAVTSIQTGRYPLSHGVINHGSRVTNKEKSTVEKVPQLPKILSESGYRTGKFGRPLGRWHRKGFDIYPESIESREAFDEQNSGENKAIRHRIGDSLEYIHPRLRTTASKLYQTANFLSTSDEEPPPTKEAITAKYRDQPDEVLQNFEKFIQDSEPFYAFIHLMDTHTPYAADPNLVKSYLDKFDYKTDIPMRGTGRHPEIFDKLVAAGEYPDIKERYYLPSGTPTTAVTDAHYDAAVTQADERVGTILSVLEECGIYDDTLIIFLSDHGESLTEHGIYYDHHGLYEVTVRVPLIVRPPNGMSKEITEFVQITDLAPTVESYTGVEEIDADGYSLRPTIENNGSIGREYILAEEAHTQRRRMVRSKNSKLIYSLEDSAICRYCDVQHAKDTEFYDLVGDPAETDNIAESNRGRRAKLRKYADKKIDEFENKRPSTDSDRKVEYEDEAAVKERLEALGYK